MGGNVAAPTTVINGHNLQGILNDRDLQWLGVYIRTDTVGRDIIKPVIREKNTALQLI